MYNPAPPRARMRREKGINKEKHSFLGELGAHRRVRLYAYRLSEIECNEVRNRHTPNQPPYKRRRSSTDRLDLTWTFLAGGPHTFMETRAAAIARRDEENDEENTGLLWFLAPRA